MSHEIRRIIRPATPEEKQRHHMIRQQTDSELEEIKRWAREAATRARDRVAVGTVFSTDESAVVTAIDDYAAAHALSNRSAVVREALSRLLNIPIAR